MGNHRCIFCDICNETAPASIMYKDAEVVIFSDIRPAAKHHFLVVPREHLANAKQLKKEHIPLVENLVEMGNLILQANEADTKDLRLGFHWPPFNSISHLHLHVISPASEMSCVNKIIFQDSNLWFVKPEYVLQRLAHL